MKQIFTFFLLFVSLFLKGQVVNDSCYHKFDNFNFNFVEKILLDSIWIGDSLFLKANFENADEAKKVKIIIIPHGYFNKTVENKTETESILNYLDFSSEYLQGLVEYKGEFVGYISANYDYKHEVDTVYLDSVYKVNTTDSVKAAYSMNRLFKNLPPKKWRQSENEFGLNLTSFNYWKDYYNSIKTSSTNYFFTANPYKWEIWFLIENKLFAKTYFEDNFLSEKDIVKEIKKADLEGNIWYYYNYVKGLYKKN